MANPTSVTQALRDAPAGTQWYAVTKQGTFNLRKTGPGKFIFFVSGQTSYPANLQDAITFYNSKGLNQANRPEWVPKPPARATKPATPAKAPAVKPAPPKGAPAPKPEPKPAPEPVIEEEPDPIVRSIAVDQDQTEFQARNDWRVRLALSPDCDYLYRSPNPGILYPLSSAAQGSGNDGVIFPYTPQISVNYVANYEQTNVVHSNYKIQQYSNSSVDQVQISCDFTAQDVYEANYLLAVIHFFRSMTKMFYGQDVDPRAGTPPPLCYMYGMGGYQFSAHPLAVTSFTYNLPNDVDYIRTMAPTTAGLEKPTPNYNSGTNLPSEVARGGVAAPPRFNTDPADSLSPTYVPTKIQIVLVCVPIISRNMISNRFSLEEYANGKLYNGLVNRGGGIW